jgi:hypothetical protein
MADEPSKPEAEDRDQLGDAYPTQCPACLQHTGKPRSAGTIKGEEFMIRLDMLCGHCAHEWTYDKLLPPSK